jgi:hypothetical protein
VKTNDESLNKSYKNGTPTIQSQSRFAFDGSNKKLSGGGNSNVVGTLSVPGSR